MNLTKLERRMAVIMVLCMRLVQPDYSEEEYDTMPADYYDWADPVKWKQSCIRPADRRM